MTKCTNLAETTKVHFHPLSKDQIEFYVEQYKPFDKAGAYAIQEWIGVIGIESIQGDFYNVMGSASEQVVGVSSIKLKHFGCCLITATKIEYLIPHLGVNSFLLGRFCQHFFQYLFCFIV